MPPTMPSLIPLPQQLLELGEEFVLDATIPLLVSGVDAATRGHARKAAEEFARWIGRATGHTPRLTEELPFPGAPAIRIHLGSSSSGADDHFGCYMLSVRRIGVSLEASSREGLLNGLQTLRQFLPARAYAGAGDVPLPLVLAGAEILDRARYRWRGLLLDCSRHFMDVDFILRLLDAMAMHRLNTLHWHLVDDQGWRLQIDAFPLLQEVSAWREQNGTLYGGYYSKDDVRRIVARATELGIRVMPEIELPGHSRAVLAAYPELSCNGVHQPVPTTWGIFHDIFCAGKDASLDFFRKVLDEVVELFPFEYIHIGGDEAPRERWKECAHCQERMVKLGLTEEGQLQTWMTQQIQQHLAARGRRIVGWDELQYGGLPEGSILQHWRFEECLKGALDLNHEVILSKNRFLYFDYPHDKDPRIHSRDPQTPLWMPALPTEKVYSFEAEDGLIPREKDHLVLGLECTVWTEHAPQAKVPQQLFPRLSAMAEVAWLEYDTRSWSGFRARLDGHLPRLRALGFEPYTGPEAPIDWQQIVPGT